MNHGDNDRLSNNNNKNDHRSRNKSNNNRLNNSGNRSSSNTPTFRLDIPFSKLFSRRRLSINRLPATLSFPSTRIFLLLLLCNCSKSARSCSRRRLSGFSKPTTSVLIL